MFIIGYFLKAVAVIFDMVLGLFTWLIVIRAILSWVNPDPYNPVVRIIYNVTDPILDLVRRRLPIAYGGIDFSPILVLLVIVFIQQFLVGILYQVAATMI